MVRQLVANQYNVKVAKVRILYLPPTVEERMKWIKKMITQERLKEILEYNPLSGLFTYKIARGPRSVGSIITSSNKVTGYMQVMIDGKKYQLHRLAFLYMTGKLPKDQVDHSNHIRGDNRWVNLREVNNTENSHNRAIMSNNKSGTTGVYWHKANCKWQVRISSKGKLKHLGYFTSKEEAIAVRKQAEIDNGYHENHGKPYRVYPPS